MPPSRSLASAAVLLCLIRYDQNRSAPYPAGCRILDSRRPRPHNPAMPPGRLTPIDFVAKWEHAELSERAASQEHFIDLCRLLSQPIPAEHVTKQIATEFGRLAQQLRDRGHELGWQGIATTTGGS